VLLEKKLQILTFVISKYSAKGLDTGKFKIKVVPVATIGQLIKAISY
jgi:hypothetical protein